MSIELLGYLLQAGGLYRRLSDEVGSYWNQLDRRRQDDACQPHACTRRVEKIRQLRRRYRHDFARAQHHGGSFDMLPERTRLVMILAVNVAGDCATQSRVAGSRRDRQEPATRYECFHDIAQLQSCPRRQRALLAIERQQLMKTAHVDRLTGVYGTVAVGASIAPRDHLVVGNEAGQVGYRLGMADAAFNTRISPPARQDHVAVSMPRRPPLKTYRRSRLYFVTYPMLRPRTAPISRMKSVCHTIQKPVSMPQKMSVVTTPMIA